MTFEIELQSEENLDALRSLLTPNQFNNIMISIARKLGVAAEAYVGIYPVARPGSAYVRTGLLGKSITSSVLVGDGEVSAVVGSNVVYSPYVLGDPDDPDKTKRQAKVHQDYWEPMIVSIRDNLPDLNKLAEAEILNALEAFLP